MIHRIAVVGAGYISAKKHLPAWLRLRRNAKVVAICDSIEQKARTLAEASGVEGIYTDLDTTLTHEAPDIVDVCAPPRAHAEIAVRALESGAHVVVEKPLAMSLKECDEIARAAERVGREVCVAHSDLFYPAFRALQASIREGQIGTLRGLRIFLSTPVDYITARRDHWAHHLPGGVVGESGPHAVYMSLAFLGRIHELEVRASKLLPQYPWSKYEDYRIELFGDGLASSVVLTYATDQWAAEVQAWGESGAIKVDLESQVVVNHHRRSLRFGPLGRSALSEATQVAMGVLGTAWRTVRGRFQSAHEELFREFLRGLEDGRGSPVPPDEGREVVRVMGLIAERIRQREESRSPAGGRKHA